MGREFGLQDWMLPLVAVGRAGREGRVHGVGLSCENSFAGDDARDLGLLFRQRRDGSPRG